MLADDVETVFLGGGTPTFTEPRELERLLAGLAARRGGDGRGESRDGDARSSRALLRARGVTRVSLGAQSVPGRICSRCSSGRRPRTTSGGRCTLSVMPDSTTSRSISSTAFPARAPSDLDADLAEALALEPEHLSCYELEAKPGTRFTHAHGDELARQADAMEGYFEQVVDTLMRGRLPLVRDRELLPRGRRARGRDLRARHNLGYWRGRDYLGVGIGAVSTLAGVRRRNLPEPAAVRPGARGRRRAAARARADRRRDAVLESACCSACGSTSRSSLADVADALDRDALARLVGARPRRGDDERARGGDPAHASRAVPRRRRHRRAHGLSAAWFQQDPRLPSDEDAADIAEARDPAARHRGVRRDRPAGGLARRSSSAPVSASRRRRCAVSSPSSRRSGC